MADQKRPSEQSVGALWRKTGARGDYFTGTIETNGGERNGGETTKIVVFSNGHKTADKHPDFKIFLSRPRPDAAPTPSKPALGSWEDDSDPVPF